MKKRLTLGVLGAPILQNSHGPLTGELISVKGQALLIYLAVTGRAHSRTSLAGLLWGDMPEESARANLRLTLSRLRKAVCEECLHVTRLEISIADFWLDLAEFKAVAPTDLDRACQLYRGDFLDGFVVPNAPDFELWAVGMRQQIREAAIAAFYGHVEAAGRTSRFEQGIQAGRKLLTIEPWHEETHRGLMFLLASSGKRAAAVTQYETCRRILSEELSVDPDAATDELYARIKAGAFDHDQVFQGPPSVLLAEAQPGGRGGSLSTSPASGARHNLPIQLTQIIGREAELERIGELLANTECRMLTLIGPGGIGKSSLALSVARGHIESFTDGVRFVSLVGAIPTPSNRAEDLLIAGIAAALDYTFAAQQPPRDLLLNHLAGYEILLVLDNFEHLLTPADQKVDAVGLLVDILQNAPRVKMLVTSQQRLGAKAEWLFDVAGLAYPPDSDSRALEVYPAADLFIRSVLRLRPDIDITSELASVVRICRLVEGFPLGLELAAGWVRTLSCAEIADRLEHGRAGADISTLALLSASAPDLSDRHQSMRRVLDYAWQMLSDEEQQAFGRLSVFRGSFSVHAALFVAKSDLATLARLVDKSWLRQDDDGRYRVHELLRLYGTEQLAGDAAEHVAAREAHANYFAHFLESRCAQLDEHDVQAVTMVLDKELENLRAAWVWLSERNDRDAKAGFLEGIWRYYRIKGLFPEAVLILSQAVDQEGMGEWQRARLHRRLGEAYYQMGMLEESCRWLETGMAVLGRPLPTTTGRWAVAFVKQFVHQALHRVWPIGFGAPQPEVRRALVEGCRLLGNLGQVYYFTEKPLPLFTVALYDLNLAEKGHAFSDLARGYAIVGHALATVPLHRMAAYYLRLAARAIEHSDNRLVQVYALQVTGLYHMGLGQWRDAWEVLERSVAILEHMEMRRWLEESWALLAMIGYQQGYYAEGLSRYAGVLDSARYRGDPIAACWALLGKLHCALRLGELAAQEVFERDVPALERLANDLTETALSPAGRANLYGTLARHYLQLGSYELAQHSAERAALLLKREPVSIFWVIEGYTGPVEVFLHLWEEAVTGENMEIDANYLANQAKACCRGLRKFARVFPFALPLAWSYQGRYDWLVGKPRQAFDAWERSLEAAKRLAMPYEEARVHFEIGRHLAHDNAARQAHLNQAYAIFHGLQAAPDVERTLILLDA